MVRIVECHEKRPLATRAREAWLIVRDGNRAQRRKRRLDEWDAASRHLRTTVGDFLLVCALVVVGLPAIAAAALWLGYVTDNGFVLYGVLAIGMPAGISFGGTLLLNHQVRRTLRERKQ